MAAVSGTDYSSQGWGRRPVRRLGIGGSHLNAGERRRHPERGKHPMQRHLHEVIGTAEMG